MSSSVVHALDKLVSQATTSAKALQETYESDNLFIPEYEQLKHNETFYDAYRAHVVLHTAVTRELSKLSAVTIEIRRYRLDSIETFNEGLSVQAQKRIRSDIQHYQDLVGELRTLLENIKWDLNARLKFFSQMEYLLTNPLRSM